MTCRTRRPASQIVQPLGRLAAILALLALLAPAAAAQGGSRADGSAAQGGGGSALQPAETEWRVYTRRRGPPAKGAIICPLTVPGERHYICFAYDCHMGEPLSLRLTASRPLFPAQRQQTQGRRPSDRQTAMLVVDGRVAARFTMDELRGHMKAGNPTSYATYLHPSIRDDVLGALGRGQQGALVLGEGTAARKLEFSLTGAGAAIREALGMCPAGRYSQMDRDGPHAVPAARPAPGDGLADLRQFCAVLGGEPEIGPGFARSVDPDGNAASDLLLDYGAVTCSGGGRPLCGAAGCLTELWLRSGPSLMRVVSEPLSEIAFPGDGVIELRREASTCGDVGPPCLSRLRAADGMIWLGE